MASKRQSCEEGLCLCIAKGDADRLVPAASRIHRLGTVVQLQAWRCSSEQLHALLPLRQLTRLSLFGCGELTSIGALRSLPALTTLDLQHCYKLGEIDALSSCTNLQALNLRRCYAVSSVEALSSCCKLRSLNLYETKVADLAALGSCTELEDLHLGYCTRVCSISGLERCTKLQSLVCFKTAVSDIAPLAKCRAIETLDLERCYDLSSIEALSSRHLTLLNVGHTGIKSDGLAHLLHLEPSTLRTLVLRDCTRIEAFEPLMGLTSLQNVDLSGTSVDPALVHRLGRASPALAITTGWAPGM